MANRCGREEHAGPANDSSCFCHHYQANEEVVLWKVFIKGWESTSGTEPEALSSILRRHICNVRMHACMHTQIVIQFFSLNEEPWATAITVCRDLRMKKYSSWGIVAVGLRSQSSVLWRRGYSHENRWPTVRICPFLTGKSIMCEKHVD